MSEILSKLDDIIQTMHEILFMLKSCEKESEVSENGRHESVIGRNGEVEKTA